MKLKKKYTHNNKRQIFRLIPTDTGKIIIEERDTEKKQAYFNCLHIDNGKLIPSMMELVRMAIPRRVYTQSHIDYVIEIILEVFNNRNKLKGYKITYEASVLRHFTAKFEPIG